MEREGVKRRKGEGKEKEKGNRECQCKPARSEKRKK